MEKKLLIYKVVRCRKQIFKLGHHGENDATSVTFLEKVRPTYGSLREMKKKIQIR